MIGARVVTLALVSALGLSLTGCGDAVWVPVVGLPWWEVIDEVPEDSIDGDCTISFSEVVVGLPTVQLFSDGEPALAPENVALDLLLGVTTLGEVRVPANGVFRAVSLSQGSVGAGTGSAADGTATEAQRSFTGGGTMTFMVTCGDDNAEWELPLSAGTVSCPVPETLEIDAQASFGTLSVFDPLALLGGAPVDAAALISAPPVLDGDPWSNTEGTVCPAE